jgi:hypothetical protein
MKTLQNLARLAALALVVSVVPTWAADPDTAKKPAAVAPSQEELEKQFADELSGATLVGNYTVDGRTGAPSEDRYKIAKATKLEGDLWRIDAQIIYGQHDVTVPLPLTVKWAGDTPVITLTDMMVPGLGTYTARVLFYRGRYAGTWSGSDHGGEMWGRLEKPAAGADAKNGNDKKPADKPVEKKEK